MLSTYKLRVLAVATAALCTSFAAHADVDISVIGKITPAACIATLANGGVVDYGTISANSLNQTRSTSLPEKTINMSLTCNAATKLALTMVDNRAGTAADTSQRWNLGLGKQGDKLVGNYDLKYNSVTVDGKQVSPLYSKDQGKSWRAAVSNMFVPGGEYDSWGDKETNLPVAGKQIAIPVQINAYINRASELDLTKEIELDGSATFSIIYL